MNHLVSSTTPIRYISPAKMNYSENTHYVIKPSTESEVYILLSENDKLRYALREKQDEINSFLNKFS